VARAGVGLPPGARRIHRLMPGTPLRLLLILGTCLLAGALTAGVALPLVGGLTALAAHQADTFENLPADLETPPVPERSVLLDSDGQQLAILRGTEDRFNVGIGQVATVMQRAIISIEDARFYQHHGVDLKGIARALVKNNTGGSAVQGASTITQQYVKNVLQEKATTDEERKAAIEQSPERKLREARYALALERKLSKAQILERYLNIAYFGQGVYGVGTAAQHYFGIPATALTLPEAALLAGLVNNPTGFDPTLHPLAATQRRVAVLQAMQKERFLTAQEVAGAEAEPLLPYRITSRRPDACESTRAPFFCDYVRAQLLGDVRFGRTQAEREDKIFNGGLRIKTTLDPQTQESAQRSADTTVPRNDRIAATVVTVEPGTGRVLAMAVNRTYGAHRPGSTQTKLRLPSIKTFQGGSTFKVFTLTTALQQGIGLKTKIRSPACYHSVKFANPQPRNCYQNAGDSEQGTFDLVSGTWLSVNTFFVQLEERTGVQAVIDTAVKLGVSRDTFDGLGEGSGSVTLGSVLRGVDPLELANAYATLAAHGKRCPTRGLLAVADSSGRRLSSAADLACTQVIDPGVADTVASVMQGVLSQPGATASGKGIGRPAAGKTGTLDDQAAAWFVGFTPQMCTAVVLGDPAASTQAMGTVQGVFPVYGGTLPATIWQKTMIGALAGRPVLPLPPPSSTVAIGDSLALPDVSKLSPQDARTALESLGFAVQCCQALTYSDTVARGAVAAQSPGPGLVPAGTTVNLVISNGKAPAKPSPSPQPSPNPSAPPASPPPAPPLASQPPPASPPATSPPPSTAPSA
jgi:membrane peptidoglycan carboxypeptidase